MARRDKKKGGAEGDPAWLVTFSDLTTLLLTFFVLLLSMSSMDVSILTRVNLFVNDIAFLTQRSAGRVPNRVELLLELLEQPMDVVKKPNRFKDLLFPDEVLPPELDRSTLYENMRIMQHPEGLALVLNDSLLFPENSAALTEQAQKVLWPIMDFLQYMNADVNIAGYSDLTEDATKKPYMLSADRALAVLNFFVQNGLPQHRFSVSAYGPNLPLADNDTAAGRKENRRVSILIKTTPFFAGYQTR